MSSNSWNPAVYEMLRSLPDGGVAAFDFDNTLIANDFGENVMYRLTEIGSPYWTKDFWEGNLRSPGWEDHLSEFRQNPKPFGLDLLQEYERVLKEEGLEAAYRWTSRIFSGFSLSELRQIAVEEWGRHESGAVDEKDRVRIYEPMSELLRFLESKRFKIYVLTASPTVLIRAVSQKLGLSEENIFGMDLSTDTAGITLPDIQDPYPCFSGKVEKLKLESPVKPNLAFGDSANDFPLLEYSETSVFLDRGKGWTPPSKCYIQSVWN